MASRSQMRLAQITGSLSSAENAAAAINEDSLQGVMDHLASAIKRITGASNYHAQAAGHFTQDLNIDGDIDVRDNAHVSGTLHSDGQATFASANVEDLTATHVLFAGASGELSGNASLVWDGSHLAAASVKVADLTENRIVLAGANGDLDDDSAFTMDGSIFTANMLVDFGSTGGSNGAADFDVAGYAQFAGVVEVDGALKADSTLTVASDATFNSNAIVASGGEFRGDLQYSASAGTGITMGDYYNQQHVQVAVDAAWLRGTGISVADTNSMDLAMSAGGEITADLILKSANALEVDGSGLDLKASIAGSRTFEDDVTVTGNFTVNGTTTYVNTTDLIVTDAKIVISSGSLVDGAGIYLGDDSAGENIRWNAADTKWIASDKLAADTLQALDLSDAIVWADASGNLYNHEYGFAHGTYTPFAETGSISLGNGDQIMKVTKLIPDERTQGDVKVSFKTRFHPNDTETTHGFYTLANPTAVRFSGRQIRLRVEGNKLADWRSGIMRIEADPGGGR